MIEERFSNQPATTITTNDDVVRSLFLAYTRASSTTRWLSYSRKTVFFSIFSSVSAHTDDIGTTTMNISSVNFPNMKFYSLLHHVIIGTRSQCPKKEWKRVGRHHKSFIGRLFVFLHNNKVRRSTTVITSPPKKLRGKWKTSCIRCFIAPPGLAGQYP